MTQRYLVIYARFSTDMQSPKSCADQEREVREALSRLGIDHTHALVIHDEAESGTKTFRDEFARLEEMVRRGEIGILAVDDQSRLTRADNAFAFITDLVYSGGRFISTGEGIDTAQTGWELRVKVMELHNSTTIRELSRRVRRGQLGRVLAGLSAGDLCFGYESYLLRPEQATANRRGPKPERGVRIHEDEARWVRQIFAWFNEGWSISAIARELNRQQVHPRHKAHKPPRWSHPHVSKILRNEKYIGTWRWGQKTTIRNSAGQKKQVPAPPHQSVVVSRPDLRIIEDETWTKAQERLRRVNDLYRAKPGDKRLRGRPHHSEVYPDNLLAGLVYCGKCGSRMYREYSEGRLYLGCPKRRIEPPCPSQAVGACLVEKEREAASLRGKVEAGEQLLRAPLVLPDEQWIQQQLANVASLLREDHRHTAQLLRRLFGRIHAHHIVPRGRKRGRVQLRVRLDAWEVLRTAMDSNLPESILRSLAGDDQAASPGANEFVLDLHRPGKLERTAPLIAELHARGLSWREIAEQTGLSVGSADHALRDYRRRTAAQQASAGAQADSPGNSPRAVA